MRASDADREEAVGALREHLVAGRLTLAEFSARVDTALRARFGSELAAIQADLPGAAGQLPPGRRRPARFTAALFGHVTRRGRLRLRKSTSATSVFGDLDLDLREATIDRQQVAVTVLALLGNVDIYVPDSVTVDVSGVNVLGHRRDWGHDAERPGAPAVVVRVLGLAGTVDVWRVPPSMRDSSYSDIVRQLEHPRRQLPR